MCICLAVVSTGKTIFVFACKVTNNYSIHQISMHLFSTYFSMFLPFFTHFPSLPPPFTFFNHWHGRKVLRTGKVLRTLKV